MSRAKRLALALLSASLGLGSAATFAQGGTASGPAQVGPRYDIEMSRMIPMRDGVNLEAWIFKPSQLKAKAPAVLQLTQYDTDRGRYQDFRTSSPAVKNSSSPGMLSTSRAKSEPPATIVSDPRTLSRRGDPWPGRAPRALPRRILQAGASEA